MQIDIKELQGLFFSFSFFIVKVQNQTFTDMEDRDYYY